MSTPYVTHPRSLCTIPQRRRWCLLLIFLTTTFVEARNNIYPLYDPWLCTIPQRRRWCLLLMLLMTKFVEAHSNVYHLYHAWLCNIPQSRWWCLLFVVPIPIHYILMGNNSETHTYEWWCIFLILLSTIQTPFLKTKFLKCVASRIHFRHDASSYNIHCRSRLCLPLTLRIFMWYSSELISTCTIDITHNYVYHRYYS